MNKSFKYSDRRGLPGGPNEQSSYSEGFVVSERGQWDYPGMDTLVPTPTGNITMQGVPYPVYGQDETGYGQMMYPGADYVFPGNFVYEIPMAQKGKELKSQTTAPIRVDSDEYTSNPVKSFDYVSFGEKDNPYYSGVKWDPKIKRLIAQFEPVDITAKATGWARDVIDYKKKKPMEKFVQSKMQDYIRSQGQFGKNLGLSMENFPEQVMQNYMDEYNYNLNSYAAERIAKQKGYNLKRREEWVDKLTPREQEIFAGSKYGSSLQPSVWARTAGGLQELGNTVLPGQPFQSDVPGLSPKEEKEYRESALSGFNVFAPLELSGTAIANYGKNRGISTGSNYAELPNPLSGERMANVSELEAVLLSPNTWEGLASLPSLAKSIPSIYKSGKALASSGASKLYETFGSQPFLRNFIPTRLSKPPQTIDINIPTSTASNSTLATSSEVPSVTDIIQNYPSSFWREKMRLISTNQNLFPRNSRAVNNATENYFSDLVDRYQSTRDIESAISANRNLDLTEYLRNITQRAFIQELPTNIPANIRTELPNFESFVTNYNRKVGQLLPPPPPETYNIIDNTSAVFDINSYPGYVRRPINGFNPGTPEWRRLADEITQNLERTSGRSWQGNQLNTAARLAGAVTRKGSMTLQEVYNKMMSAAKKASAQADVSLGKLVDKMIVPKVPDFSNTLELANQNLQKGMGIAKIDKKIVLKPGTANNAYDIATRRPVHAGLAPNKAEVYIDGVHTGTIDLPPTTRSRKLTDILKGKSYQLRAFENSPIPGLRKASDYPFENLPSDQKKLFYGQGISGEINKALSESLKSQGSRLYSGATGHTGLGQARYDNLLKKGLVEEIAPEIFMYKQMGGPQYESDDQFQMGTMNINIQDIPDDVLAIMIANNR